MNKAICKDTCSKNDSCTAYSFLAKDTPDSCPHPHVSAQSSFAICRLFGTETEAPKFPQVTDFDFQTAPYTCPVEWKRDS